MCLHRSHFHGEARGWDALKDSHVLWFQASLPCGRGPRRGFNYLPPVEYGGSSTRHFHGRMDGTQLSGAKKVKCQVILAMLPMREFQPRPLLIVTCSVPSLLLLRFKVIMGKEIIIITFHLVEESTCHKQGGSEAEEPPVLWWWRKY